MTRIVKIEGYIKTNLDKDDLLFLILNFIENGIEEGKSKFVGDIREIDNELEWYSSLLED